MGQSLEIKDTEYCQSLKSGLPFLMYFERDKDHIMTKDILGL